MTDVLMHAAPDVSADLFHALPADIGDPLTYLEVDGRRLAVVSTLDREAVTRLGVDVLDPQERWAAASSSPPATPCIRSPPRWRCARAGSWASPR